MNDRINPTVTDLLVERISISVHGVMGFIFHDVSDDITKNSEYDKLYTEVFSKILKEAETDCKNFGIDLEYRFISFSEHDSYRTRQNKIIKEVPELGNIKFSGDYSFNSKAVKLLEELKR